MHAKGEQIVLSLYNLAVQQQPQPPNHCAAHKANYDAKYLNKHILVIKCNIFAH